MVVVGQDVGHFAKPLGSFGHDPGFLGVLFAVGACHGRHVVDVESGREVGVEAKSESMIRKPRSDLTAKTGGDCYDGIATRESDTGACNFPSVYRPGKDFAAPHDAVVEPGAVGFWAVTPAVVDERAEVAMAR